MAFVKKSLDGQKIDAPVAGVSDPTAVEAHRLRCAIMVGMQENGWGHREIGWVVGMDQGTVSRHLAAMPDDAKKYYAERVAKVLDVVIPRAPVRRKRGPKKTGLSRGVVNFKVRQPLQARHAAAEAEIDARCLAAVERFGTASTAARYLGLTHRRIEAAVARNAR